jgi:hypothetical protein
MTVAPAGSSKRKNAEGALASTDATYVEDEPVGVTADDDVAGPTPHVLSATTENVAAALPDNPLSAAVEAAGPVAIETPACGPVASRITYALRAVPFPDAALQVTVAWFVPGVALTAPGADGSVHDAAAGGARERVIRLTEPERLLPPMDSRWLEPSGSRRNATTPGEAPRGWNEPAHVTDSRGLLGRADRRAASTRVARVPTEPADAGAARGESGRATAAG